MVALVGHGVAIMFLTMAYKFYMPWLTGMAIALHFVASREVANAGTTPVQQQTHSLPPARVGRNRAASGAY